MSGFDDLLARIDGNDHTAVAGVLDVARREVPDVVEGTSYGMPVLLHGGRPLLGLTASARHLSLHPFSPAVVEAVAGELPGHSLSKGTIRFTGDRPIPDDVVARIVALRVAEIDGT